jgi:hypothetical protein
MVCNTATNVAMLHDDRNTSNSYVTVSANRRTRPPAQRQLARQISARLRDGAAISSRAEDDQAGGATFFLSHLFLPRREIPLSHPVPLLIQSGFAGVEQMQDFSPIVPLDPPSK